MATVASFQTEIKNLVFAGLSSDAELGDDVIQSKLEAALERYSHDDPEETTEDFSGDGGKYYDLTGGSAVLSAFVDGFSQVLRVEYPAQAVSSDAEPQYLENDDWDDDYWAGGVRYLYLRNHAPAAADTVRIRFTSPYSISAGSVSTPAQDFHAIACLAGSLCCETLAIRYSRSTDSTISADSVDHLSKADQFSRRARDLMQKYNEQMGFVPRQGAEGVAGEGGPQAFGMMVDMDTQPTNRRRWLTHGGR